MVVFNNPGYYHALDQTLGPDDTAPMPPITLADGTEWTTSLGPKEIGTSANPMQPQTQALIAKIREGASRVELEFPGAGKGSSQAPTPESYGERDRMDMRELARANEIKTTVHATFQRTGFSGLGERGFSDEARYQNIKEVKKAIEFAAEATTGGAVVFHTGEWQRPISETWGKGKDKSDPDAQFRAFDEEEKRAAFYMVDSRTGEFVSAIRKDKELFRPVYKTAADMEKETGRKLVGQYDKLKGGPIAADDLLDINYEWIDEKDQSRAFERVPQWDAAHTKFEVKRFDWNEVVKETDRFNEKYGTDFTPERMFVQIEQENAILQAKGHSLFYANRYEEEAWQEKKLREALDFYKTLDKSIPEEEKWKLMTERGLGRYGSGQFTTPDSVSIPELIQKDLKQVQDTMRHTHEASASADAQAKERERLLESMQTIDQYGLKKSTEGIARAGLYAMEQTHKNREKLEDPIYVAPENWQAQMYGGHPDELIALVKGARQQMAKELVEMRGKSQEEAAELAKTHIKSTIDIGHLNLWRQHFVAKEGESDESRNKRFNEWAITKTKDMIKEGIVGHLHIADNLGWDDEHLIPGEGNAPIREFVAEMEKAGFKDFIVEPGSFHPNRTHKDAMKFLASPVYAAHTPFAAPMGRFHSGHLGYNAPSMYIVGAYAPSNEWKLWSEVPLE